MGIIWGRGSFWVVYRPSIHHLYFIYKHKIYVRTRGKITHQWKANLNDFYSPITFSHHFREKKIKEAAYMVYKLKCRLLFAHLQSRPPNPPLTPPSMDTFLSGKPEMSMDSYSKRRLQEPFTVKA